MAELFKGPNYTTPSKYGHYYIPSQPGLGNVKWIQSPEERAMELADAQLQQKKAEAALARRAAPPAAPGLPAANVTTGGVTGVPDALTVSGQPTAGPGVTMTAPNGSPIGGSPAYAPGGTNYSASLTNQALSNIQGLLSRNPDTREWDTTSAERAAAGGIAGSPMAAAEGSLLRQSEIDKRNAQGMAQLEPYLARQQDTWQTIEKGRQAKELLQLSEAGQMARLTQSEQAQLEQIAAQGANALAQTRLSGEFGLANANTAANTSRQNAQLSANTELSKSNAEAQLKLELAHIGADTRLSEADKRAATERAKLAAKTPTADQQAEIDDILAGGTLGTDQFYNEYG